MQRDKHGFDEELFKEINPEDFEGVSVWARNISSLRKSEGIVLARNVYNAFLGSHVDDNRPGETTHSTGLQTNSGASGTEF